MPIRAPQQLQEIEDAIRADYDYQVTPAQIKSWVHRVLGRIHREHNFSWMMVAKKLDIPGDDNRFDLPYNLKYFQNIWRVDDNLMPCEKFIRGEHYQLELGQFDDGTGDILPAVLNEQVTGRQLKRVAFSSLTPSAQDNVWIYYFRFHNKPTQSTDLVDVPGEDIGVVIDGVSMYADKHLREWEAYKANQELFVTGLQTLIDSDVSRGGGLEVMIPANQLGENVDFYESDDTIETEESIWPT